MMDNKVRNIKGSKNRKKVIFKRRAKRMLRTLCRCLVTLTGWVGVISTPMLMAAVLLFG